MVSELGRLVKKSRDVVARHNVWSPLVLSYKFTRYAVRAIAHLMVTRQRQFSKIYENQIWGGSGPGSTLAYTKSFRKELECFLGERRIGTLFDAPCGDMKWMRVVELPPYTKYIGGDIVSALIDTHRRAFDPARYQFRVFDITRDNFPTADLWLCRDCLFHFSYRDIFSALRQFARSEIPFALITNHLDVQCNSDTWTGAHHRLLDLTQAPFNLPSPSFHIEDWVKGHSRRIVGLWSREAIAGVFSSR